MSAMTVAERLADAYRRQARVERCACGGTVWATGGSDDEISKAVASHNASPTHQQWRHEQLAIAERELHVAGKRVPDDLLLRGKRCPCGGHAEEVGVR